MAVDEAGWYGEDESGLTWVLLVEIVEKDSLLAEFFAGGGVFGVMKRSPP